MLSHIASTLLPLLLAAPGGGCVVVLRDGREVRARAASVSGALLIFEGADGGRYSIAIRDLGGVRPLGPAPPAAGPSPLPAQRSRPAPRRVPGGTFSVLGRGAAPPAGPSPTDRRHGVRRAQPAVEEAWRSRVGPLKRRVALARIELEAAERELAEGGRSVWVGDRPEPARSRERAAARAAGRQRETGLRLEQARARLQAAEAELGELRERARREGAPPGWLR